MNEIISCTNPNRIVSSLLNGGMGHNNNSIRRLMTQCLCCVIEHHGPDKLLTQLPRDVIERYLSAIITLSTDADVGTRYIQYMCTGMTPIITSIIIIIIRYHARRSVKEFCCHPEFESYAAKFLSKPQFAKIKDIIETLRTKVFVV